MPFRFSVFLVALLCFCLSAATGAEPQGKLIVKLTIAGTGDPVAGARVHAHFGIVRAEDDKTPLPDQLTDEHGRLELAVPWGNLRLTPPASPPGFWPVTTASLGL